MTDKLSPERRELVQRLLAARKSGLPPDSILVEPGRRRARLSYQQKRVWLVEQITPGTTAYCESHVFAFERRLDPAAVERALGEIVGRHSILRTAFAGGSPEPEQVIAGSVRVDLPVIELPAGGDAELARLAARFAREPFDLAVAPLLRAQLVQPGSGGSRLLVAMHHLVCDGWSMGVFAYELMLLLDAFAAGRPASIPPPAVQYADFAEWQRDRFADPGGVPGFDRMAGRLAAAPPLELPLGHARPPTPSHRGGRAGFAIPPELGAAVADRAGRLGVTPFVFLLAAFAALVARYSRQRDFAVGIPASGRGRAELEGAMGFFTNMLAVRLDVDPELGVRRFVAAAGDEVVAALAHQDVPLELVLNRVGARDPSRNPVFQVAFQLFTPPSAPGVDPASVPQIQWVDAGGAKFDLRLDLHALPGGWSGYAEYASDLFERAEMERFAGHYVRLLQAMAADLDAPLGALPLASEEERAAILDASPNDADAAAEWPGVPSLFAEIAARTPDATALAFGSRTLSYLELDRRSGRLASWLSAAGVGAETPVGLCMERSADLVVAMLAVLKAGGAYVPLDPDHPEGRIRYMMEDAGVRHVVAGDAAARLSAFAGSAVIGVEDDEATPAGDLAPAPSHGGSLAYISYTSGSTGEPKGVEVTHAGIVRLVRDPGYLQLKPGDRVAQASTALFDAITFEVWGALLNGATLVGIMQDELLDADALAERLRRDRIGVLFLTTDLFHQIAAARPAAFATLDVLLFGGAVADAARVRQVLAAGPPGRLLHVYGPTECTTFATWHPVESIPGDARTVPIGRPIRNTVARVLDDRLGLLPPGVPGELCLGGPGLARGYRGRPELTAAAFVLDPFGADPGDRLYRTGDLVRRDADGLLHFLGRRDRQVKISGRRIEPGEIEAALRACPGVEQAAIVAHVAPGDRRQLAGYVVAGPGKASEGSIMAALRERLPSYMLPASLAFLERLPLKPNGKVDHSALPAPGVPAGPSGAADPSTPKEAALAAIWAELLGLDRVGIHDNFFALGGDSILSLQVIARARKEGLDFTARQFFENQTVAELARVAASEDAPAAGDPVGPYPPSPIQRWFFAQGLPDPHQFNQSVMFRTPPLDEARAAVAVGALVAHHDALRTRFRRSADEWRAEVPAEAGEPSLRVVRLADIADSSLAAAIEADAEAEQSRLDLEDGRLFRATLYDCGAARPARLLFTAHHLVVDAVSWMILLDDFFTAYAEGPEKLPPRTTPYRVWAERLSGRSPDDVVSDPPDEAPSPAPPPLPRDLAGDGNRVADAAEIVVRLDPDETRALLEDLPKRARAEPQALLVAALAAAVRGWTGQAALALDIEGHGRDDIDGVDLSRTVGWFTRIDRLRIEAPDPAPAAVLLATQAALSRRGDGPPAVPASPAAGISFNYLGGMARGGSKHDAVRVADEEVKGQRSPRGERPYLIEANMLVHEGRFEARFTYARTVHRRRTVERLASNFLDALRDLDRASDLRGPAGPAGFSGRDVSQRDLDAIAARLARARDGTP